METNLIDRNKLIGDENEENDEEERSGKVWKSIDSRF